MIVESDKVTRQIAAWRKELINLDRRNRLLYYKPTQTSTVEIVAPAPATIVDRLFSSHSPGLAIVPTPEDETELFEQGEPGLGKYQLQAAETKQDQLSRTLLNLERKAVQQYLDRGLWTLFLGVGMLEWNDTPYDSGEPPVQSPLLMVPVELEHEAAAARFSIKRSDEEIALNPALCAKLLNDFEIKLELPEDLEETDVVAVLDWVRSVVGTQSGWKVLAQAVLSTFSFHKEAIYKDLLQNEKQIAKNPLVTSVILGNEHFADFLFDPIPDERLDQDAKPEDMVSILDADSSQRRAIVAATQGRSFVLDGPPGTGKSQTIANIICEQLARGKTVLFASEKAAALEVVSKRLGAAGLGEFILELHSHKATRKEVAQRLGASLHSRGKAGTPMTEEELYRVEAQRLELTGWAAAMNELRLPLKKSLFEVVGIVSRYDSLPAMPLAAIDPALLTDGERERRMEYARALSRSWGPIDRGEAFLWDEPSIDRLNTETRNEIDASCSAATDSFSSFADLGALVAEGLAFPIPKSLTDIESLLATEDLMSSRPNIPFDWLLEKDLSKVEEKMAQLSALSESLHLSDKKLLEMTRGKGRSIAPTLQRDMRINLTAIEQVGEPWKPMISLDATALSRHFEFFKQFGPRLKGIAVIVNSIVANFSHDAPRIKVADLPELVELARNVVADQRPEPHWLSQDNLEKVIDACKELRPILVEHANLCRHLDPVFSRSIMALDLEAVALRFQRDFSTLRWFKSQYWKDKKALQPYCLSGKVRKVERGLLSKARDLKSLEQRIEARSQTCASLLGRHWQREKTDVDHLESAIAVADRAILWFHRGFEKNLLRSFLCDSPASESKIILEAGNDLHDELDRFKHQIIEACPGLAGAVTHFDAAELSSILEKLWKPYQALSEEVGSLNQLCTSVFTLGDTLTAAEERARVHEGEEHFRENEIGYRAMFGQDYRSDHTDWPRVQASIRWAAHVRQVHPQGLSDRSAQMILSVPIRHAELVAAREAFSKATMRLLDYLLPISRSRQILETVSDISTIRSLLDGLSSSIADIAEAIEYRQQVARAGAFGLGQVVDTCIKQRIRAESVPFAVDKSILECWIKYSIGKDGRLKNLQIDERQRILQEFRNLDTKLVRTAASRITNACNQRRPRNSGGTASIIAREAEKQRRHMPIRALMEKAGPVIQDLKPCFMMSPLSVSQFVPPQMGFDTVIFDEASQVKPEDAINCIYRGRQLIVAGDENQLPPTTFFEQSHDDGGDDYVEEAPESYESVLGLCKGSGAFQNLPLLWHYRSRHEHLILFSNYSFYNGRLVTFPGCQHEGRDLGVEFYYVPNAVYRRGTARDNLAEAKVVAERVLFHLDNHRDSTIGIVALSEPQAFAIERELDQALQAFPELLRTAREDRLGGLFVKNLETVQGDERDIIIISIGYGRDETGKFIENFGPLNRKNGWRRLNVAITRARKRVEVVSSIRSEEISRDAGGAGQLKKYLLFAANSANRLSLMLPAERANTGDLESPLEEEVAETIRKWGYDTLPQVGCSEYRIDLAVLHPKDPSRFVLGIECDGATYHSSKVARDRDRLRQQVLEGLGWTIYRVWGLAWHSNRKDQERRLREAIEHALHKAEDGTPQQPISTPTVPIEASDVVTFQESANRLWTVPYRVKVPTSLAGSLYEIHDPRARRALKEAILSVVEVEGPVSSDTVTQRVRDGRGLGRAGNRIREAVESCLTELVASGKVSEDAGFFLLDGKEVQVRTPIRSRPETERDIDEISDLELMQAIVGIVADSRAINADSLVRELSRLYGWQRFGDQIRARTVPLIRQMKWRKLIGELNDSLVPIEKVNGDGE
jgi:very-short-patch-repair endonuclease